jgi:hypothetical protein
LLLVTTLLTYSFFLASSKEKIVEAIESPDATEFTKDAIYVWVFEGKKFWSYFWSFAIPAVVILCCLMPLWPDFMKNGLWYVSVTLLLATLGLTVVRFLIFLTLWLFGLEFWIFPNLFDESLSVVGKNYSLTHSLTHSYFLLTHTHLLTYRLVQAILFIQIHRQAAGLDARTDASGVSIVSILGDDAP